MNRNPHEEQARIKKCDALEQELFDLNRGRYERGEDQIDAEFLHAALNDDTFWTSLAAAAGVHPPSIKTRHRVISSAMANLITYRPLPEPDPDADPFVGF